jgi:hypothetical protein
MVWTAMCHKYETMFLHPLWFSPTSPKTLGATSQFCKFIYSVFHNFIERVTSTTSCAPVFFSFEQLKSIYFTRFKINVILAMYHVHSMFCAS